MIDKSESSFSHTNLHVDYISLNILQFSTQKLKKIAQYLFSLGFNSFSQSGNISNPQEKTLCYHNDKRFKVLFIQGQSYWNGTIMKFSGQDASQFYELLKNPTISHKIFHEFFNNSANLGRFDLYYPRNHTSNDELSSKIFFLKVCEDIPISKNNVSYQQNRRGIKLTIGSRRSDNFIRVYEDKKKTFLKFELEMKGKFLKPYHELLVSNSIQEFEQKLTKHFFSQSAKMLPLHYSQMDWLAIKLRQKEKPINSLHLLRTDYIQNHSFSSVHEKKRFLFFVKFLSYIRGLDYLDANKGSNPYQKVSFRIQDFLKFLYPNLKTTSYYQLKKVLDFLNELQDLQTFFAHLEFQKLSTIQDLQIRKEKKSWTVEVWINKKFLSYQYPFVFPDFFKDTKNQDLFLVQFEVLKVFSSEATPKNFFIPQFLLSYKYKISTQRRANIHRHFLEFIQRLQKEGFIESYYKSFLDRKFYTIQELTIHRIAHGFTLYEKLSS